MLETSLTLMLKGVLTPYMLMGFTITGSSHCEATVPWFSGCCSDLTESPQSDVLPLPHMNPQDGSRVEAAGLGTGYPGRCHHAPPSLWEGPLP